MGSRIAQTVPADHACVTIRNVTRDTQIADKAEIARSGATRSKGLLGRKGLGRGEGMWIVPCEAVHTFFMQFPSRPHLSRSRSPRKEDPLSRSGLAVFSMHLCALRH